MTDTAIHVDFGIKVNSILMKFVGDEVRRCSQSMKNAKESD